MAGEESPPPPPTRCCGTRCQSPPRAAAAPLSVARQPPARPPGGWEGTGGGVGLDRGPRGRQGVSRGGGRRRGGGGVVVVVVCSWGLWEVGAGRDLGLASGGDGGRGGDDGVARICSCGSYSPCGGVGRADRLGAGVR